MHGGAVDYTCGGGCRAAEGQLVLQCQLSPSLSALHVHSDKMITWTARLVRKDACIPESPAIISLCMKWRPLFSWPQPIVTRLMDFSTVVLQQPRVDSQPPLSQLRSVNF